MKLTRRGFSLGAATLIASPAIVTSARAQAITLRMHHFLPPLSNAHSKLLAPWAKKVEADSQGQLKIDIFPSMQLGGTPPQLFDQARDGVADIVWTLPGNTPGRFPRTEVFELPFIAANRAIVNARAANEFTGKHLMEETREVKLLAFWAHDAGVIHANRQVRTMDDLKGLKLRNPTRLAGEALKALGATSVGMPVPQVPESLAQKVIDGAVIPWEVVPAVKVHELTRFHTEIPGSPTLYTATFFLAMNRAKYYSLSAELRAVLDKNLGMVFADMAGNMWDSEAKTVSAVVRSRGNTITVISEEEKDRWIKATEPVHAAWIEQMKSRNIDGAALIAEVKSLIAKYEKTA
ncbi:MAG: TRAP transporter substrate-binding protein [Methylobacterium sp.]|nr:TRAP transporter substrate-binding protein [Methylobacterium sp.]